MFSIGLKLKIRDLATAEVWGTSVAHILVSTLLFFVYAFLYYTITSYFWKEVPSGNAID